ncbi:MAG: ATP-binding protein [Desulfobulbaceae bacterium]|nr:ATP-binding protein [Desulfobulbaceae bacterium]
MTSQSDISDLLLNGETLTVEFKSDRKCLADRDLIAAVVALANTEGGDLLLGVEDDGTVTGLHGNHRDITGMAAFIANRTNPALTVSVALSGVGCQAIARIRVPKSRQLVATS